MQISIKRGKEKTYKHASRGIRTQIPRLSGTHMRFELRDHCHHRDGIYVQSTLYRYFTIINGFYLLVI
jgi:hypothetical protein